MMEEGDRMKTGYSKQIQERINGADDGTIFVNSDFADIADSETTRRNLNRLTQIGVLRRILKGVYEKPKYSKLLDEYVAADPDAVAKALARSYHWTIVPCGNTALNLLGLSTQVTAVWSYISDGPYKTYEWNSTKLEFKHRTNKEITGLSYMTSLVIQALKTLGRINVTAKIIQTLSEKLTEDEKRFYTWTLQSHIDLAKAVWLDYCECKMIDTIAREPLWRHLINYRCGTGHSVSFVGNVHEGPHSLRGTNSVLMRPGMVVTDEPGVYETDLVGIRIENELVCVHKADNQYGTFLGFEPLMFVPIATSPILPGVLDKDEIAWLNDYHRQVFAKLAPHLNDEERSWLARP